MKPYVSMLLALSFVTALLMGCQKTEAPESTEAASTAMEAAPNEVDTKPMAEEPAPAEPGGWSPPAE